MNTLPAYVTSYKAECIFKDPTSEWFLVRYQSLVNNKQVDKYSIRHCCTNFKQDYRRVEDYIFRNEISTLNTKCEYCHTVAPKSLRTLFVLLVME